MLSKHITVILLLCLAGCATQPVVNCPQPPPSLLIPADPLGKPDEKPARTQLEVVSQYVEDVGKYEALRLKHNSLAGWWQSYCTGN